MPLLLRWTTYAIAIILLLSWSYLLYPAGVNRVPERPASSALRDANIKVEENIVQKEVEDKYLKVQQDIGDELVKLFIGKTDQPLKLFSKPHQQGLNRPKLIKRKSTSHIHGNSIKTRKTKPSSNYQKRRKIPFRNKDSHQKQRKIPFRNKDSHVEDSNPKTITTPQNFADSVQVQNNVRYKQVLLDQAERKVKSKILPSIGGEIKLKNTELELIQRREQVQQTCYKYGLGMYKQPGRPKAARYPPSANYGVLYIDGSDALTWCPVYKAASTTWLFLLSQLAGAKQSMLDNAKEQISIIARRLYPSLDSEEAKQAVAHTTKFMIVRHPFERIVSAYRDKLENLNVRIKNGAEYFHAAYGKSIVQKYRKSSLNSTNHRSLYIESNPDIPEPRGIEPTFEEFVKYLIDTDLMHHANEHWKPYYLFCTPCYIDYDVIAKFETLDRDQQYLLHKLNLENKVNLQWRHLTKGQKTNDVVNKYMQTISKSDIIKLGNKYKIDFEMFNYSFDKY